MGNKKITTQIKENTYLRLREEAFRNRETLQTTIDRVLDRGLEMYGEKQDDIVDEILALRKEIKQVSHKTMEDILKESRAELP